MALNFLSCVVCAASIYKKMGNSLLGNSGSLQFPWHVQLRKSAAIDMSTRVDNTNIGGRLREIWTVLYTVDGSTCKLNLTRIFSIDGSLYKVEFKLNDKDSSFMSSIERSTTNSLHVTSHGKEYYGLLETDFGFLKEDSRKLNPSGDVTETKVYWYGCESNRNGLLVLECKKNGEHYIAATLAHYFAFNRAETDIGLSVIAKFRPSNGKFDITVEGPCQHPASELFYMFHEVFRNVSWKPEMCSHCDHKFSKQPLHQHDSDQSDRYSNSRTLRHHQSDQSEDRDSGRRTVHHHGSWKNLKGTSNSGEFMGNNNGNVYERFAVYNNIAYPDREYSNSVYTPPPCKLAKWKRNS